ncbi:SDR family oxidoreductase [Micropruina sp.]|uniref:SDR family oxidoreductase n=1 Tax=Micropruina sp. TaxID=2737536 RepID=UPI0039E718B7
MTSNRRRLAVAGGTGLIGRMLVALARENGWTPVVLARSSGVDLFTGAGLHAALDGVDTVIDVTNTTAAKRSVAIDFFGSTSENLVLAGQRAGVRHHLTLSIVGIDRVDTGYYAGKRRQEEVVAGGAVPWTILRATQFYEFTEQMLNLVPGPVAVVPRMLSRPIAAREVAGHLLELADGAPGGRVPEMAGPAIYRMADLVRQLARARALRRPVWELPAIGAVARAAASGGLLPTGSGPRGSETFEHWLNRTAAQARPVVNGGRS